MELHPICSFCLSSKTIRLFIGFLIFSSTSLYGMKPDKEYILTPDSIGVNYESMQIRTSDGLDLNTWVYLPNIKKENDKVLILAYHDSGNMSYFVYHAATLAAEGYTVVTFDYRGFGKSSDFSFNPNFLYHTEFIIDLVSVGNAITDKFPRKKTGIWAVSMGTVIATRAMEQLNENIDFIVGEGYITDTLKIVERMAAQKDKVVQLPESGKRYQISLNNIAVPLLILSASNDQITTVEDSLSLKNRKGGQTEVVIYEGEHLTGFQANNDPFGHFYIREINKFVTEYL